MAQSSSKQRAEAEVLDLKGKLRQLNKAVAEKGATIDKNAPLVATIKAVEGLKVGGNEPLTVFKSKQFQGWMDKILPPLKISEGFREADLTRLFSGCENLVAIPHIDGTESVKKMSGMISKCTSLKSITLPDLPNVVDMTSFADGCTSLEQITVGAMPKVTTLMNFLSDCVKLKSATFGEMPNVHSIRGVFGSCNALERVDLNISIVGVFDARWMFYECANLHTIAGVLDFSNAGGEIALVEDTFKGCSSLKELRLKWLGMDLDLSDSPLLSIESVKYLVENLQQATGKSITLHRAWQQAHTEEAKSYAQIAAAKGFALTFR